MVKVQFKNTYENIYGNKEYTYKDYEGAAVGDVVVVNTQNGYAIARVSQVNVIDYNIDVNKLSTVEKVIITQEEIDKKKKAEYERREKIRQLAHAARKKALIRGLSHYLETEEQFNLIYNLSEEELVEIQKFMLQ